MKNRLSQLKDMLAQEPNDVFLHYAMAMEELSAGKVTEAIAWFSRVISLDNKHIPAHFQLGKLMTENGQEQVGITYLQKGLELARSAGQQKTAHEIQSYLDELLL